MIKERVGICRTATFHMRYCPHNIVHTWSTCLYKAGVGEEDTGVTSG